MASVSSEHLAFSPLSYRTQRVASMDARYCTINSCAAIYCRRDCRQFYWLAKYKTVVKPYSQMMISACLNFSSALPSCKGESFKYGVIKPRNDLSLMANIYWSKLQSEEVQQVEAETG